MRSAFKYPTEAACRYTGALIQGCLCG